jgi:hypothetical protein
LKGATRGAGHRRRLKGISGSTVYAATKAAIRTPRSRIRMRADFMVSGETLDGIKR